MIDEPIKKIVRDVLEGNADAYGLGLILNRATARTATIDTINAMINLLSCTLIEGARYE